jgi:hypothetical protein
VIPDMISESGLLLVTKNIIKEDIVVEKDKVYKYLNPVGIHDPVEVHPLAPRLDTLEGKNIVMSVGAGGEQGILIPLVKKLPEKFPQVKWTIHYAAAHATKEGSIAITEEQMRTADALIRGVVW